MFKGLLKNSDQYTLIIDIGSGSVGAAIVDHGYKTREEPEACVWSKRLYLREGNGHTFEQNLYNLKSTLLNTILAINSEGVAALFQQTDQYSVTSIEVVVSSPWVQTTPHEVRVNREEAFLCNTAFIKQLSDKATNDAVTQLSNTGMISKSNAAILNNHVTHLHINGYRVTSDTAVTTTNCTFTHYTSLIDTQLQTTIQDLLDKSFPNTPYSINAFLPIFARVVSTLTTKDTYSLIDITFDGTELGVVRDKTLTFATHAPLGVRTIAMQATNTEQPTDTALAALSQFDEQHINENSTLAAAQQTCINEFKTVAETTPSGFTIPHHLIILVEKKFERFFKQTFRHYFVNTHDITPTIIPVSSLLPEHGNVHDIALQLLITDIINTHESKTS